MASTRRNAWASGIRLTAVLVAAAPAASAEESPRSVVVRVFNYAGVPPADLAGALSAAARVYAAIGVELAWTDRQPVGVPGRVPPLALVLLPRDMTEKKAAAEDIPAGVLGRAAAATGRAYAFYHRTIDAAARARVDDRLLLGKVIAHEVGHLLLGDGGHAEDGIMRAGVELRGNDERFTAAQARTIRALFD
jgi:hypothetical protein